MISADFDDLIPMVDGIIYSLNPLKIEEFELFKMYFSIIQHIQRDIPTIIMYYDDTGIIPISINDLFENIWYNYPNLEVFVNLPPIDFHQVLECLCLAMIGGDTPLNIENAWMRFPIFIELANMYFSEQNYEYAAHSLKKATVISEIYSNDEFFIQCEQTSYLFSKVNFFLEAAKILEIADRRKSKEFKRIYGENMILEGDELFDEKKYDLAALQYEKAAQWISFELADRDLIQESFKKSITSWISSYKCEKAFRIIERLSHEDQIEVLVDITEKIIDMVNHLISIGDLVSAKEQLYYSISVYQKYGLFDVLNNFTEKLLELLITILKQKINEKALYFAEKTLDEIENLRVTYEIEEINLDKILEKLIRILIEELVFDKATDLINKLNSLTLKQKLTKLSSDAYEEYKSSKKQKIEENIRIGVNIIKEFNALEQNIIVEMNKQKLEEANEQKKLKNYLNAAKIIKNQSSFLKNIGEDEIADHILTKSLDILIGANHFEDFFKFYRNLSEEMRKKYLKRIYPLFFEKLQELKAEKDFEKKERIFEISIKKFRNGLLYDESKEISKLFIKTIKAEALRIVESEETIFGINKATNLIKNIDSIVSSYLDQEKIKINFDKIFKKIAEIYIDLKELSLALTYRDRINKKEYKDEVRNKLEEVESELSEIELKKIKESLKEENLESALSIIKNKGKDTLHDREQEFKQRKGLKRAYFKEALDFVKREEFENAIRSYKNSIIRLNRIKKYNLAGVSLIMASFLLLKDENLSGTIKLLEEIKNELSSSGKLFSETFSVTLLEYLIEVKKRNDESKLSEALSFMENLPLFEDELKLIYDYLGKEYKKEEAVGKLIIGIGDIETIKEEIHKLSFKIEIEKQDASKRKFMKKDYWNKALEEISNSNFMDASSIYFKSSSILAEKKFFKHTAIGFILGSLILIKERDFLTAKSVFEDNLNQLNIYKKKLEALPEIQYMEYVFLAYENYIHELIELTLTLLLKQLKSMLFKPEIDFITMLSGEEISKKEEVPTELGPGEMAEFKLKLDQISGALQQNIGDISSESQELLKKRRVMKKRYYDDILNLIIAKSFMEASNEYLILAENFIKRKDYNTSALLILLYGLSALKTEDTVDHIKTRLYSFIESIGLSKKSVKDTYYVSLMFFILEVITANLDQYKTKFKSYLEILPLFEEEKELIEIKR